MDFALFSFEQLDMWKLSMDFVSEIYELLKEFPDGERYALTSQIRRAAISVPSNIAEGTGRFSIKEKLHFNE
jgi:four helix bundle protein